MKRLLSLLLLLGLFAVTLLLSACGTSADPVPTKLDEVPRITIEELKERLDNNEDIVVVDTRGKNTYDIRHIRGAIVEPDNFDEYPLDQEIIFYTTWRDEFASAGSALKLYEKGYTNVSALLGGFVAWKSAGYPTDPIDES